MNLFNYIALFYLLSVQCPLSLYLRSVSVSDFASDPPSVPETEGFTTREIIPPSFCLRYYTPYVLNAQFLYGRQVLSFVDTYRYAGTQDCRSDEVQETGKGISASVVATLARGY